MASVARTVKGFLGAGCIAALAAACASETDSAESVGSSSQALNQPQCAGDIVRAFPGDFSTPCMEVSTYTTVTAADVSLNQVRAQSYFSYLLGGPVPPASLTIGATTYAVRDKYFGSGGDGRSTSAMLCALRSGIARGSVAIRNLGNDTVCSSTVGVYKMLGTLDNSDCNGVLGLPAGSSVNASTAVLSIAQSIEADRNWCPLSGTGAGNGTLPSFFKVAAEVTDGSVNIDPEPVTLSASGSLGTSSGATAAATGNDTAAIYSSSTSVPGGPVYRWSSTPSTCGTTLNNYLATKTFGVPCFTIGQTGTQTSKYIKKDPVNPLKCLCLTP